MKLTFRISTTVLLAAGMSLLSGGPTSAEGERRDFERREGDKGEVRRGEAERRDGEKRDFERKDGERRDGERREGGKRDFERAATGRRAVLVGGLLRTDAEVNRFRDLLKRVPGVTEVTLQPGEQAGLVRAIVTVSGQDAVDQALKVTRGAGIETDFVQWLERREGEGKVREGDRPSREGDKRLREGDRPFREGDKPFREGEGKLRDSGRPSPEAAGKFRPAEGGFRDGDVRFREGEKRDAARPVQIAAGPIRSDQQAFQIRRVLLGIEGLRDVTLRPVPGRPTVGIISVVPANEGALKRALSTLRGAGLEAQLYQAETEKRDGYRREGDRPDSPRPEGERRDRPRGEGERPGGERREGERR